MSRPILHYSFSQRVSWIFAGHAILASMVFAQAAPPNLTSLYPVTGATGCVVELTLKGNSLSGAYGTWFGPDTQIYKLDHVKDSAKENMICSNGGGLLARVQSVPDGSQAVMRLSIDSTAKAGNYTIYLITPDGMTNRLGFLVAPHAVFTESKKPHDTPDSAPLVSLPVDINGQITAQGEVDYYAFEISNPQTLQFEVIALNGQGFDPVLALFDCKASWLDRSRGNRLIFREEERLGFFPPDRKVTYDFKSSGRFVINVSSIFAGSGKDYSYVLRIAPAHQAAPPTAEQRLTQAARYIESLQAPKRETGKTTAPAPTAAKTGAAEIQPKAADQLQDTTLTKVTLISENENGADHDAVDFALPALLEGAINSAADKDVFTFKAAAGEEIVCEINSMGLGSPILTPRVSILDDKGEQVLTNVKNLKYDKDKPNEQGPKLTGEFEGKIAGKLMKGGEYHLVVQDLSGEYGGTDFQYQIMVRNAIPHLGGISAQGVDRINLAAGSAQTINVRAAREEGYNGEFALSAEGLPEGVHALFGVAGATMVLAADQNAPPTSVPRVIRLAGFPVIDGKPGPSRVVQELPVMVLKK